MISSPPSLDHGRRDGTVVVVTPPAAMPVTPADVRRRLRIDAVDDDQELQELIDTATQAIDGPSGWLGRALMRQTLEWRGSRFEHIRLLYPPIVSIVSVAYDDVDGVAQTVDPSLYRLVGLPDGRLEPSFGARWPVPRRQSECVRVRYVAGYGDDAAAVPAPIRTAILLTIGHLYENRQAVYVDPSRVQAVEMPQGADALLAPFRVFA